MNLTLPHGYTARPPEMEEAEALVKMGNAYSQAVMGVDTEDIEATRSVWTTPGLDPKCDLLSVYAPGGQMAGYIEIWDLNPNHVRINSWGRVHPNYWGKGVGKSLVAWGEQRARESVLKAPAGTRVVFQQGIEARDEAGAKLFSELGFHHARSYWVMKMELVDPPGEPLLPEGIHLRPMAAGEEREVVRAEMEAFRDHYGFVDEPFEEVFARWQHALDTDPFMDPAMWLVAVDGKEIAGMALNRKSSIEDPEMGWVANLGVRRPWRKQGLGLALLQASFREYYRRGKKRVGLGVDSSSLTGATRLYEKAGMHIDRQMLLFEKELRPGIDMMTNQLKD